MSYEHTYEGISDENRKTLLKGYVEAYDSCRERMIYLAGEIIKLSGKVTVDKPGDYRQVESPPEAISE